MYLANYFMTRANMLMRYLRSAKLKDIQGNLLQFYNNLADIYAGSYLIPYLSRLSIYFQCNHTFTSEYRISMMLKLQKQMECRT